MSVEPGGRGAKYGDEYENRHLARLLLRLVEEKLSSVIVEPISEYSDSVEFSAVTKDGTKEHIQCKVSNGTYKSWTIDSLQKHDVFMRAKRILIDDPNSHYLFISGLLKKLLWIREIGENARKREKTVPFRRNVWYNKPRQNDGI